MNSWKEMKTTLFLVLFGSIIYLAGATGFFIWLRVQQPTSLPVQQRFYVPFVENTTNGIIFGHCYLNMWHIPQDENEADDLTRQLSKSLGHPVEVIGCWPLLGIGATIK
jgi:hypothetical protein